MSYIKRKRRNRFRRDRIAYRGLKERTVTRYSRSKIYLAEKDISELLNIDKSLVKIRPTSSGIKIKIPASINIDQNLESIIIDKARSLVNDATFHKATHDTINDEHVLNFKLLDVKKPRGVPRPKQR